MTTARFAYAGNRYSPSADKLEQIFVAINDGIADDSQTISFVKPIKESTLQRGMVYEWDWDGGTSYTNRRMVGLYGDDQKRAEWTAKDYAARAQKTMKSRAAKENDSFDEAVALLRPLYQKLNRTERIALMIRLQDELARR